MGRERSRESDRACVAERVERVLDLASARLPCEYYYSSLPLCVIDAVYSIGVRYGGVRAVVKRYCDHFGVPKLRSDPARRPPRTAQESISDLCGHYETLGVKRMTQDVFVNRQRTSTRNGILKAEAVWRFAQALQAHHIDHLQDVGGSLPGELLEQDVRSIPGQRSGISLQYFWMLSGSDNLIILRFLEGSLKRQVPVVEALPLLLGASTLLTARYPNLTPRLLDYTIWEYQRKQDKGAVRACTTVP
jgi:hypothetical protein